MLVKVAQDIHIGGKARGVLGNSSDGAKWVKEFITQYNVN